MVPEVKRMNKMGLNRFDYKTDYIKFLAVALSSDAAYAANEVARNIENEIAYQREITDEARGAIGLK